MTETSDARAAVLARLADAIVAHAVGHPLRVAVDGVDGAGKTTLADELAPLVAGRGRTPIRASIDGFHHPRAERYGRGATSPDGYYLDSFDHDALISELLAPLGPEGDRRYRLRVFDHRTDRPADAEVGVAPQDAVLILDGVFLHRPEVLPFFDVTVFVRVSFETALARVSVRDAGEMGGTGAAVDRYERRYVPAQRRYLADVRPEILADVVLLNDDPAAPELFVRTPHRDSAGSV